jgi:hypothetical protein
MPEKFVSKYPQFRGQYINPVDENWTPPVKGRKFKAPLKMRLECAFWRLRNRIFGKPEK